MQGSRKAPFIIWAVNPLEAGRPTQKNVADAFHELAALRPAKIEPAYVVPTQRFYLAGSGSLTSSELRHAAQAAFDAETSDLKDLPLLPLHCIEASGPSLKATVDPLCEYAKNRDASLIVAATHSRSGMRRFFLGSFTESLIIRSTVPVLTINPHFREIRPFQRILFPTDFSHGSYRAFREAIELARKFKAKMTIFHAVPFPIEPYTGPKIYFTKSQRQMIRDYIDGEVWQARHHAHGWIRWAREKGVPTDLILEKRAGGITQLLLLHAQRIHATLILMEAQQSPLSSGVFGSVARQVVRHSHCPVWILSSRYAQHGALERQRARQARAA